MMSHVMEAYKFILNGELISARSVLTELERQYPSHIEVIQLMGSLNLLENRPDIAKHYLRRAVIEDKFTSSQYFANAIEAYRRDSDCTGGRSLIDMYTNNKNGNVPLELIKVLTHFERQCSSAQVALELASLYLTQNPLDEDMWFLAANIACDDISPQLGEQIGYQALNYLPKSYRLLYQLGSSIHLQHRIDEALEYYFQSYNINSTYDRNLLNMAAAFQGLGRVDEALYIYELLEPLLPTDGAFWNNYGALLGIIGRHEKEIDCLKKAVALEPFMREALVNLAGHYQDDLNQDLAVSCLFNASISSPQRFVLSLRMMLMLTPVSASWENMIMERLSMEAGFLLLLNNSQIITPVPLSSVLDRIPFYVVYHSLNDRYMQELLSMSYRLVLQDFESISVSSEKNYSSLEQWQKHLGLPTSSDSSPTHHSLIRIGFLSKYFGVFEPHGLLLDGVMRHLPREHFTVLALPVARTDGKPLSPSIREAVDKVVEVSLNHHHAIQEISHLQLDILVFADVLSEPMNHFLSFFRLAPIQIAFWGNPITSASRNMDYFISGEFLEHPYRTHIATEDEPYSEQVVLLEGQGIWYDVPQDLRYELNRVELGSEKRIYNATRADFNLPDDENSFLFLCPQSTFKIHPLFDGVFRRLLLDLPANVHVAIIYGRRKSWTERYQNRILQGLPQEARSRFHIIPRVSSERFLSICALADVILHPYPFDGSRTSADALLMGVPIVTLPTEYLRGRMGAALMRTLNLPELVAHNASHYLHIAKQLYHNPSFFQEMKEKLGGNRNTSYHRLLQQQHPHLMKEAQPGADLLWEDLDYAYSWTRFLLQVCGKSEAAAQFHHEKFVVLESRWKEWQRLEETNAPRPSLEDFFSLTDLLRLKRRQNQQAFDNTWSKEDYLLNRQGRAVLETFIDDPRIHPRVFRDWQDLPSSLGSENSAVVPSSISQRIDHFWNCGSQSLLSTTLYDHDDNDRHHHSQQCSSQASLQRLRVPFNEKLWKLYEIPINSSFNSGHIETLWQDHTVRGSSIPSSSSSSLESPSMSILPSWTAFVNWVEKESFHQTFSTLAHQEKRSCQNECMEISRWMESVHIAIRLGHIEEAWSLCENMSVSMINQWKYDLLSGTQVAWQFLVEIGGLLLFRGQYQTSERFCFAATQAFSTSSIAWACTGVSRTQAQLVGAIESLEKAWSLDIQSQRQNTSDPLKSDVFAITRSSLKLNLVTAFKTFGRYESCLSFLFHALEEETQSNSVISWKELQDGSYTTLRRGAIYILYSFVEWSPLSAHRLQLQRNVYENMGYLASSNVAFYDELKLRRVALSDYLNIIIECVSSLLSNDDFQRLSLDMFRLIKEANIGLSESLLSLHGPNVLSRSSFQERNQGIVLITQVFISSNPLIMNDMKEALYENMLNPHIKLVILLSEVYLEFQGLPHMEKLQQYVVGRRLTFQMGFDFARSYLSNNTVILANADIYFDNSLSSLDGKALPPNLLLAISKYREIHGDISFSFRTDSQDAWIFNPIDIPRNLLDQMNFPLGAVRADNVLAGLWRSNSSLMITNPALFIRAIEKESRTRNGSLYSIAGGAFGPMANVFLSDANDWNH